jgi:hypothetical protein
MAICGTIRSHNSGELGRDSTTVVRKWICTD